MENIIVFLLLLVVVAADSHHYRVCSHSPEPMENITYVDSKLEIDFKGWNKPSDFRQLRIKVVYDKSADDLEKDKKQTVQKLVPTAVNHWSQALKVRRLTEPLRLYRKSTSYVQIGRKRCSATGSCAETTCGEVVVPEEHLLSCCDKHGNPAQGTGEDGPGVPDADFILYISAIHSDMCSKSGTVAYAGHCEQEPDFDRPVAGFVNICPHAISTKEMEEKSVLFTIKHELLHALGFSTGLFAYYRDAEGRPFTPRLGNRLSKRSDEPYRGVAQWSDRVVRKITRKWKVRSGFTDKTAHYLVTPKVVAEVRKHFDCPDLEGAELEDQGGEGTALTHFEKRVFGNELMTGVETDQPTYSRLTFAVLEDTGWYKVDYSKAQPLQYGHKLGCDLCMKSCKEWMDDRRSKDEDMYPFCEVAQQKRCSSSHHATVTCGMDKYETPLPALYQNFDKLPNIPDNQVAFYGGTEHSDYCPTFEEFQHILPDNSGEFQSICMNSNKQSEADIWLEKFGKSSKCFDLPNMWNMTLCPRIIQTRLQNTGCFKYSCSTGKVYLELADRSLPCFYRDQRLQVKILRNNELHELIIICPACDEICNEEGDTCNEDDKAAAQGHKYDTDTCSSTKMGGLSSSEGVYSTSIVPLTFAFLLLPAIR